MRVNSECKRYSVMVLSICRINHFERNAASFRIARISSGGCLLVNTMFNCAILPSFTIALRPNLEWSTARKHASAVIDNRLFNANFVVIKVQ